MPVAHGRERGRVEAQMGEPACSDRGDSYGNETSQGNGYTITWLEGSLD